MSQRQIVFYLTPLFLITCIYPDKGVGSTADAVAEDALAVPPIKVKGQVPIESKRKVFLFAFTLERLRTSGHLR
ncbi:hypothetical protein A7Q09_09625 [Methylacidiphilum sp. Yel]|uniref:hypothetical protein n=1 Tax=Methylacidiphilum sp. Yel TaxID=1847730 RepID=UPI0011040E89|nr:hypothetical protein [Methylacidiphilum sp. Yel]TFE66763.1 hypothetical protein A7Q09_09625 [Methylacidiphilum sp. Yel]